MKLHQIRDAVGVPLNAYFVMRDGMLILQSRSGTKGSRNVRNTQHGPALRILLERGEQSNLNLAVVWVDSSRVQSLEMQERQILTSEETGYSPEDLFTILSKRMVKVGPNLKICSRGNSTKKLSALSLQVTF